jgi:2-polyprenyl-6-hydroxyphenyl methylase/3-demethylubiquinone-9 3-methyltransferase
VRALKGPAVGVRGTSAGPPGRSGRSSRGVHRWVGSLTIDRTRPVPPARCSIDNEYYEGMDELWWDPAGPAAILHAINRPRVDFYLKALGDLRGRLVLDAGCGGGLVARELASAGARVIGVDRSRGSLGVARRAAGDRFGPAQGRLERLPFADGAFDAVVAADVLEHLPDLPAAVAELARVLAPGGSFAFDTINRTPWSWFTAVFGLERVLRIVPRGTHDWRLFIRPAELDSLLAGVGLRPVELVGLAPRIGPLDVARGLLTRRLDIPQFAAGSGRRASYLGHYRKQGSPGAPEGSGEPQRGASVGQAAEGDSPRMRKGSA